jgi:hypothetical protein
MPPQAGDEYIHASGDEKSIVFPDCLEEDIAFDHFTRVTEEHLE